MLQLGNCKPERHPDLCECLLSFGERGLDVRRAANSAELGAESCRLGSQVWRSLSRAQSVHPANKLSHLGVIT